MTLAIFFTLIIFGLIIFIFGAKDAENFKPLYFVLGVVIIVIGILAFAWVPALERVLAAVQYA